MAADDAMDRRKSLTILFILRMRWIRFALLLLVIIGTEVVHGQDKYACQVLENFVSQKSVQQYLQLGSAPAGDLLVMDSSGAFRHCPAFIVGQLSVKVDGFDRTLNLDPQNRKDIARWQRKVLVYKYEIDGKFREVYFFFKVNNAVGSVRYKVSDKGVEAVKYNLSQL